ncbi:MAG TPA: AIPR family protein [Actinophytocola sp.]|uniref:AIPR family protein n=1 Tax=Actinophytocola sp. TaxID=1872138 RepID=UPI002E0026BE|nr:AIPR family protein [Actinophytocola sp.]
MDLVIKSKLEQFRKDWDLTALSEDQAFEAFAGFSVLSSFYEDKFSPDAFRTGGGNDLGIDVFGMLVNGELLHDAADVREVAERAKKLDVRVVVIQAKTSASFETKVVSDLAENLRHILGPEDVRYPSSSGITNIRECLQAVYGDIGKLSDRPPRLHVRYISTGEQVAEMIDQKARSAEDQLTSLNRFEKVDFRCVTRHELRELYQRATTALSATFTMPKKITLPRIPGVEQSFQGLLAATELVDNVLTDPGGGVHRTLFLENVRDFLGYDKNDVNQKIRETLRDPERRQRFAVLNNGVTIVARELTTLGDEIRVRDFQIVNGCQTCHVLFDQRSQLTDAVQVSVRLVHSSDEDVIRGIVAATNRQTAISEEDLSAREEFHQRLEEYFAAHDRSQILYYERRAKQYNARTDVEKTRIISRGQLTRAYLAMFLNEPSRVGHYKALVAERGKELFKEGQQAAYYYTAAATSYRLEWLLRNRRIQNSYAPARYHLLAAIKMRILGPGAPSPNSRTAIKECDKILKVVWKATTAEQLVLDLLRPLQRAVDAERALGVPLGEMVRTQRFAERVRVEVLGPTNSSAREAGNGTAR